MATRKHVCIRSTCRAARRNAVLRPPPIDGVKQKPGVWRGSATGRVYQPPVRLNRSRKWPPKKSYAA